MLRENLKIDSPICNRIIIFLGLQFTLTEFFLFIQIINIMGMIMKY